MASTTLICEGPGRPNWGQTGIKWRDEAPCIATRPGACRQDGLEKFHVDGAIHRVSFDTPTRLGCCNLGGIRESSIRSVRGVRCVLLSPVCRVCVRKNTRKEGSRHAARCVGAFGCFAFGTSQRIGANRGGSAGSGDIGCRCLFDAQSSSPFIDDHAAPAPGAGRARGAGRW